MVKTGDGYFGPTQATILGGEGSGATVTPTVLTQTYRLKISIDGDRKASVYVNGSQYGLTQKTYKGADGSNAYTAGNHLGEI